MNASSLSRIARKLAAACWLIVVSAACAQNAVETWVQRYGQPANSIDDARKVVTDFAGNVIVAGSSDERINGKDFLIIKYSGAGVPLWTNRYSGPAGSDDYANALAVDSNGNVFVTGSSGVDGSTFDFLTVAYSAAGVPLWTNRYDGPGISDNYANALAVDNNGNVFVTGSSWGGDGSSFDYATVAYSGAGVPLWTNRYNGPGNSFDTPSAVVVDGSGNVFVTGSSYGAGLVNVDYATVAYSGAGVPLWTNRYSGPGISDERATALAVDGAGNVFVTGWSYIDGGLLGRGRAVVDQSLYRRRGPQ